MRIIQEYTSHITLFEDNIGSTLYFENGFSFTPNGISASKYNKEKYSSKLLFYILKHRGIWQKYNNSMSLSKMTERDYVYVKTYNILRHTHYAINKNKE